MISWQKGFALAVALPVLVQLSFTVLHWTRQSSGETVELKIEGFDPRDLLAGHYLLFRVDYEVAPICHKGDGPAFVCLRPSRYFESGAATPDCQLFISGSCAIGQFKTGLDRYYIPAEKAAELEQLVRDKRGMIQVSVSPSGHAAVKALLIDGKKW